MGTEPKSLKKKTQMVVASREARYKASEADETHQAQRPQIRVAGGEYTTGTEGEGEGGGKCKRKRERRDEEEYITGTKGERGGK